MLRLIKTPKKVKVVNKNSKKFSVNIVTLNTKRNNWCDCAVQSVAEYSKLHKYNHIVIRETNRKLTHLNFKNIMRYCNILIRR